MRGIEQKTFAAMAGEHVEPANSDADTASTPGRPDAGSKSALALRLETISSKAVEKLDEIMGLPLDPDHPAFAPVLRAQTAAANTALSTQAKIHHGRWGAMGTIGCRIWKYLSTVKQAAAAKRCLSACPLRMKFAWTT
jgi:hypothetical protein